MIRVGLLVALGALVFNGLIVDAGDIKSKDVKNPYVHGKKCAYANVKFLYDDSGSVRPYFSAMKTFMKTIVNYFCKIGIKGTQFGAACFAQHVNEHFKLSQYDTRQQIIDAINAFTPRSGFATKIADAFKYARLTAFTDANKRDPPRNNARDVVIMITDGQGNGQAIIQANLLKSEGVTIIAVGVGSVNIVKLNAIASPGLVFLSSNFPNMIDMALYVAREVYLHETRRERGTEVSVTGTAGPKGKPGPQGPPGPNGLPGPKGPQGAPGATGGPGDEGLEGKMGEIGKPGEPGSPGSPGEKGEKGQPGADGGKGPAGELGIPGKPGLPGAPGKNGRPGKRGDRGPEGPKGYKGSKGSAGENGANGQDGDPGDSGPNGLPGDPGSPGLNGETGPRGPTGPPGTPYPIEIQPLGPIGDPGPPGPKGKPGRPGTTLFYVKKYVIKYGYK